LKAFWNRGKMEVVSGATAISKLILLFSPVRPLHQPIGFHCFTATAGRENQVLSHPRIEVQTFCA